MSKSQNTKNEQQKDLCITDKHPRFKKCKEMNCEYMLKCQQRLTVELTNHGYTMDYFCPAKGVYVYYE
jgi:hypothetical protein